jgi:hypothetical protein
MNPAILAVIGALIEVAKPEVLSAIKTLRARGALTDEEIASTEAKSKVSLEQLECEANLPPR